MTNPRLATLTISECFGALIILLYVALIVGIAWLLTTTNDDEGAA